CSRWSIAAARPDPHYFDHW
nr:immunoglobulin heavy chain junction region [Macaca mulatta]